MSRGDAPTRGDVGGKGGEALSECGGEALTRGEGGGESAVIAAECGGEALTRGESGGGVSGEGGEALSDEGGGEPVVIAAAMSMTTAVGAAMIDSAVCRSIGEVGGTSSRACSAPPL